MQFSGLLIPGIYLVAFFFCEDLFVPNRSLPTIHIANAPGSGAFGRCFFMPRKKKKKKPKSEYNYPYDFFCRQGVS